MIDAANISEIFATYKKYGWLPRRVLITESVASALGDTDIFDGIEISRSDVDAAWFSRSPADYSVAWELRHLSETPYALVENLDENAPDFEENLRSAEDRLRDAVAAKRSP